MIQSRTVQVIKLHRYDYEQYMPFIIALVNLGFFGRKVMNDFELIGIHVVGDYMRIHIEANVD